MVLPQLLGLGLAAEELLQRRIDDERAKGDLGRDEREGLCGARATEGSVHEVGLDEASRGRTMRPKVACHV